MNVKSGVSKCFFMILYIMSGAVILNYTVVVTPEPVFHTDDVKGS